jgi:hypothetical protein
MTVLKTFVELTGGDKDLAKKLEDLYVDVEKVDMIVGCQCGKPHLHNSPLNMTANLNINLKHRSFIC